VTRTPTLSLLALGMLLAACAAENAPDPSGGSESTGGANAASGGAGGTAPGQQRRRRGGATVGGSGGSGGAGVARAGLGGVASVDAPAATAGAGGATPPTPPAAVDSAPPADAPSPSPAPSDGGFPRHGAGRGALADDVPGQRLPRRLLLALLHLHGEPLPGDDSQGLPDRVRGRQELGSRVPHLPVLRLPSTRIFPQDHDSHCRHAIGLQGKCGEQVARPQRDAVRVGARGPRRVPSAMVPSASSSTKGDRRSAGRRRRHAR
jgi:hypothetical protein